jgi:hypothetical protein
MSRIYETEIPEAIEKKFNVPEHVKACASAIRYDLMHGPCWAIIPGGKIENFTIDCYATYPEDLEEIAAPEDIICETYSGPVYDELLQYWENLPNRLYYDAQSGELLDSLPEPDDEDDGDLFYSDIYTVHTDDIRAALFGKMLAKEFG